MHEKLKIDQKFYELPIFDPDEILLENRTYAVLSDDTKKPNIIEFD